MTNPVRFDQIAAADWQLRAGELGAVVEGAEDVAQSIRTILATPRGSLPLAPEFGSALAEYLDQPVDAARPHLVRETVDAVTRWEPRAEVVRVAVQLASDGAGVELVVEWRFRGGAAGGVARVEVRR
jgi:phage baseplate assembly protein W